MSKTSNNKCHQSIDGDASGLYPEKEGSSPSDGSCMNCGSSTSNPKFCNKSCSATFNNKKFPKRKKSKNFECLYCGSHFGGKNSIKFCNSNCSARYRVNKIIHDWINGLDDGLTVNKTVKSSIKDFYRFIYDDKCSKCGWSKINKKSGKVPLEMNHIDGNHMNNHYSNLEIICPNCHSLTENYRALNVGSGRKNRVK